MKAVIAETQGGPSNLVFHENNDFAGVNYVDVYFRSGVYPSPNNRPGIIGQEASGTIVEIKGTPATDLKVGDSVVWISQGAYAEYTALPAERVFKIPEGVSRQDAVGGFLAGMTALTLVEEAYPVQKGQTVLVHAAAGGLGSILVQVLRGIGAVTIGTAGGPTKCALAAKHGANHVIDYSATSGPSWVEQVQRLTGGQGVDVVFDLTGKSTWEGSIAVTNRKGKVVYVAIASGPIPPFRLELLTPKNLSVIRPTLAAFIATREELQHYANGILAKIRDGTVKVDVTKIYGLADAHRAHEDLESQRTTGKILLKL
ncbi:NADPH:quinone reductase [Sporothrix bragantina]|uniref:NADPH:quinone reductase n=1 Tax=Sporothrix bragantina TaxID=671064 RepID=A0ABP0CYH9_9PEZI